MTIPAKPTEYRGTMFRSRLEARWAAFFDLVGWKWVYEPFELNYYIPDFILIGKDQTVLVEVKPYFTLNEFKENGIIKRVIDATEKTEHSDKEILFLGNCLPKGSDTSCFDSEIILGWIYERFDLGVHGNEKWKYDVSEALFNNYSTLDFQSDSGSYKRRMDGFYDGDHYMLIPTKNEGRQIEDMFNKAGTIVRYNHSVNG